MVDLVQNKLNFSQLCRSSLQSSPWLSTKLSPTEQLFPMFRSHGFEWALWCLPGTTLKAAVGTPFPPPKKRLLGESPWVSTPDASHQGLFWKEKDWVWCHSARSLQLQVPGIEPATSRMQRSWTFAVCELHDLPALKPYAALVKHRQQRSKQLRQRFPP